MSYETLLYAVDGPIATITLNRPESLNTIVPPMPDELQDAVLRAGDDEAVRVIVLRGAGRAFCAGFDFGGGFHHWDERDHDRGEVGSGQGLRGHDARRRARCRSSCRSGARRSR